MDRVVVVVGRLVVLEPLWWTGTGRCDDPGSGGVRVGLLSVRAAGFVDRSAGRRRSPPPPTTWSPVLASIANAIKPAFEDAFVSDADGTFSDTANE